jgi:hypothetical protein
MLTKALDFKTPEIIDFAAVEALDCSCRSW